MKKIDADCLNPVGALGGLRSSFVLLALSAATAAWAGPDVTYVATDLPDVIVGEDLWSYDYMITGPLGSFEAVNLLFSSANYGGDILVITSDATLSPLVTPPILAPAADGLVSVTALDPLPSTGSALLSVQFVWTAIGAPGSQPFDVLDDQFNVTSMGMTTPVPEVSTASLLFAGLLALSPLLRRRRGD